MNDPFGGARGMSFVVFGALGLRALWSLSLLAVPRSLMFKIYKLTPAISGLLIFLAVVATMIWLGMLFSAIRRSGAQTKWSPAFAALGWLIPFANFILPPLAMQQALKIRAPQKSSALIWVWWGLYWVHTILNMTRIPLPIPYLGLLILLALVATWGAVVYTLSFAPAGPVFAGAVAPQQGWSQPPQQQWSQPPQQPPYPPA